jgi:16S rRNA (cytidine1402-2'-O)-methyltransferase
MARGSLYLVPVTLGGTDADKVIPSYVLQKTISLRFFISENIRSSRRYLRMIDKSFPIDESNFRELSEHTKLEEISDLLNPAINGNDIGLMSEAGMPSVADPGSLVVEEAHKLNIRVIPLSGPSSILLALVASGLNGQSFAFHGYLPVKNDERDLKIREYENAALKGVTQIFMETPYRNTKLFEALLKVCRPETKLTIAADITLPAEEIKTMKISEWRRKSPLLDKRPVIFLLGT